jgi:glycosyltransferase involved in cell wall biosynthesis
MSANPMVSIIINNYNYAHYLPAAIDSALQQSYHPIEVIVVDDGSTDNSTQIIAGYGEQVRPVLNENGGQASAFNAGFAASHGELVMYLDADDLLLPQAVAAVTHCYRQDPGVTRIQFKMQVIDAEGRATGETKPSPHVPVPAGDIRRQALAFPFDLPWLPTSGNAFPADYLRKVMPVPVEDYGRVCADYYLVHMAPLFGRVAFLDKVCACYRVHGSNHYEPAASVLDLPHLRSTLRYDTLTYAWIQKFARHLGLERSFQVPADNRSVSSLAIRLVSLKLDAASHPVSGDSTARVVRLGMKAALARFDLSLPVRLAFAAWFLLAGMAPRPAAAWLAEMFFFPVRRVKFNRLLGKLHRWRVESLRRQPAAQERVP